MMTKEIPPLSHGRIEQKTHYMDRMFWSMLLTLELGHAQFKRGELMAWLPLPCSYEDGLLVNSAA